MKKPARGIIIASVLILNLAANSASSDDKHYLLSCGAEGSVSNSLGLDGRTWHSDNNSTFSHSFNSTTAAAAILTGGIASQIPYSTARLFSSNFTYSFPVSPGPKFIRLFFNPSSAKDAYLTVQASTGHLLLHNFSAPVCTSTQDDYVEKEYYLHVNTSLLQLTFLPTPPASSAFVNGIEVVSVPENLYIKPNDVTSAKFLDGGAMALSNTTALENAYRFIAGGQALSRLQDNGSMYRKWNSNLDLFLVSEYGGFTEYNTKQRILYTLQTPYYSAPELVYQTSTSLGNNVTANTATHINVTWGFEVESGFLYLVRLHWCEDAVEISASSMRVFDVYIHELMAEKAADIVGWVQRQYTPIYKDYIVYMDDRRGKSVLHLAMHPDPGYMYTDFLLNGLEIFKISRADGSLNGSNDHPSCTPAPPSLNKTFPPPAKSTSVVVIISAIIAGAILLSLFFCCCLIFRRRKYSKTSGGAPGSSSSKSKYFLSSGKPSTRANKSGGGSSYLPSHLCRHFSLMEIRNATSDFSESLIVGHGGFGNVYKGTVETEAGPTLVAIKRLNALSTQGAREFVMEIQLLSKLRHINLVSLIGYCDDDGEMILVYEYMSHGTLRDHLHPNNTQLSWQERLEVCVGAARGLNYLHTGTHRMVIHRDIKTANILLDDAWIAKVADFGLSKLGPTGDDGLSHVSTKVKGSFGYVDPEYYRRQQLTEKSDVYSFGVVLFEVLCGRAAVNPNLPKEQVNLRTWARWNQLSGTLDTIVDPKLVGQIAPESLRKFGEVAESCVRDEGGQRPSMVDVIGGLELALKLQMEDTITTAQGHNAADKYPGYPISNIKSPTTDGSERLLGNTDSGDSARSRMENSASGFFSSSASQDYGGSEPAVFSEIFKPEGR